MLTLFFNYILFITYKSYFILNKVYFHTIIIENKHNSTTIRVRRDVSMYKNILLGVDIQLKTKKH